MLIPGLNRFGVMLSRGNVPAGRPLYSSLQAPAGWSLMCKWLNDTVCHGRSFASYLCENNTHTHKDAGKRMVMTGSNTVFTVMSSSGIF